MEENRNENGVERLKKSNRYKKRKENLKKSIASEGSAGSAEFGGERICVLGDARAWAKRFGTIEYEILVKLNSNIPRRFQ